MSRTIKGILVVVFATVLTTLTINAGDNIQDLSKSLLGSVLPLEKNACPENMVFVATESGGFCIDTYEVSASKDCLYTNPGSQDDTRANIQQKGCLPLSKKGATPWRFIAQHQASLACVKAGKRLPTNDEWYRAAMGTPDATGAFVCALGMTGQSEPTLTGTFEDCVSFAGAYDMIGNVWEWVDETVQDGVYRKQILPKEGYVSAIGTDGVPVETGSAPDENFNQDYFWLNAQGTQGMFRGGYWGLSERAGVYGVYSVMNPSFVGPGLGFRCVK